MMKGKEEFKKIVLGTDHGGYEMKEYLKGYLSKAGYEIEDVIPEYINPISFVCAANKVCNKVKGTKGVLGILFCGTGIGVSMAANRHQGIRAALMYDDFSAEKSRTHNNANILAFGGRTMKAEDVARWFEIFMDNEFLGGKYAARNDSLDMPQDLLKGRKEEGEGLLCN